jgi:hypothetical protein
MPKTRNHVCYRIQPIGDVVEILVNWNATAGPSPNCDTKREPALRGHRFE